MIQEITHLRKTKSSQQEIAEISMTGEGSRIQKYLEKFELEMSTGFQKCDHVFYRNGSISCVRCGKTKVDI